MEHTLSHSDANDRFPVLDLFQGTDGAASRLVLSAMRTSSLLDRVVAKALTPFGLHHAQLNALLLLTRAGERGLRPSVLGEALCVSRPNVTKLLSRLLARTLVVERPDPIDGRAVLAVVTTEGVALAETANAAVDVAIREAVAQLSTGESEDLHRLLDQFRDRLALRLRGDSDNASAVVA
jgi:DNA-binding MarR family transcriptional regulator